MEDRKCPKCDSLMEKGIVRPNGGHVGTNIMWGNKVNWCGAMKNGKKVAAYRCKSCGYIEQYTE